MKIGNTDIIFSKIRLAILKPSLDVVEPRWLAAFVDLDAFVQGTWGS